jgi:hypothetical protein
MMLSPQELIGQKVWLSLEPENAFSYGDPGGPQVKAEITQPTSPPWFYARYLNPPASVRETGQWLSFADAQQAVLLHPVIEPLPIDDELEMDFEDEEYDSSLDIPSSNEEDLEILKSSDINQKQQRRFW